MKTLRDVVAERSGPESNNFLILRLVAATLVIYGHSYVLAAPCMDCRDVASSITGSTEILSHRIGLFAFFVISGFLVTKSCLESSSAGSYFAKRVLRIFPGLAVCSAILAFGLGPAFTTLPLSEYLGSYTTWSYFLTNASTYHIAADLPGVALRSGSFATAINGNLWTIPVEVRLYILVGVASVAAWRSKIALNLLAAAFIVMGAFDLLPMITHGAWEYRLAALFAIGALMYVNRDCVPYSPACAVLLVLIAILSQGTQAYFFAWSAALVYGVMVMAYGRKIPLPRWLGDYSYGIYLYSFPIQQLVAHYLPSAGPHKMFLIAAPLAWVAGAISWTLIEQPALQFKRKAFGGTAGIVAPANH
jgi:peptidoglycan/LPS O-acetylase OafA/YrhL